MSEEQFKYMLVVGSGAIMLSVLITYLICKWGAE